MPCVLLTLDSEEVRGEAFLPGRQVPGNELGAVFFPQPETLKTNVQ